MNKRLKNSVLCLLFAICLLFSYCQNTYAAGSVAKVYYFTVGENCLGPGTSSYIVSKLSGIGIQCLPLCKLQQKHYFKCFWK